MVIFVHKKKKEIWLVVEPYTSEKYERVNWDDDHSQLDGKIKHVPKHQPEKQGRSTTMVIFVDV